MTVHRSDTVFVLGAGFSAHASFPVVRNMRKAVLDHLEAESHLFFNCQNDRNQFHAGLNEADAALAVDGRVLDESFEELLITLGKMKLADRFAAAWTTDRILRCATGRMLWGKHNRGVPEAYLRFTSFARNSIGIVSFNWDILLETTLHMKGVPWGYSLNSPLPVIKPHGSINWSGHVQHGASRGDMWQPVFLNSHLSWIPPQPSDTDSNVPVSDAFWDPFPDSANSELNYMLFPGDPDSPDGTGTASADEMPGDRRFLWEQAGGLFSRAQNVVLIGYSLPTYDQYAKDFLIRACKGKHVEAVNPNPRDAQRIKKEIGAGAGITLTSTRFEESDYASDRSPSVRELI
jgi:hypothetical protein